MTRKVSSPVDGTSAVIDDQTGEVSGAEFWMDARLSAEASIRLASHSQAPVTLAVRVLDALRSMALRGYRIEPALLPKDND